MAAARSTSTKQTPSHDEHRHPGGGLLGRRLERVHTSVQRVVAMVGGRGVAQASGPRRFQSKPGRLIRFSASPLHGTVKPSRSSSSRISCPISSLLAGAAFRFGLALDARAVHALGAGCQHRAAVHKPG